MNKENGVWTPYKERTDIVLNSAGELYYNLSNQCIWEITNDGKYRTRYPIVISNVEGISRQGDNDFENIISLTQIKLTGKPSGSVVEELGFRAYSSYASVEAAYSLVRSQFEKKITVNYVDLNGNSIAQDEVKKVEVNKDYDVSDLINKEIDGYSVIEVKGDVTGTANSDKEVTVVYGKNYQLNIQYLDENGNKLAKDYTVTGIEGNDYDLSLQVNVKIDGYELDKVIGDLVTGIIDQNKVIKVLYVKKINSDITNNNSNKPDQTQTGNSNNTTSLKTGDDVNMTFTLIGLCLSVLMGWVCIRKSKKFKDE